MDLIPENKFGERVLRRLKEEKVIWLTTIDSQDRPQPRPVWFLWRDDHLLTYSKPGTHKLDHIRKNPKVSLHFNTNPQGGDVIVFSGEARIAKELPAATEIEGYIEKYQEGLARLNDSPANFASDYSVPIVASLTSLRGH